MEIRGLCLKSREIFLSQPILLELEAPLKICGKHKCIKREKVIKRIKKIGYNCWSTEDD